MEGPAASRRARAAWAYSRLDQRELAEAAGIHYDRLRALLSRTGGPSEVAIEELWAIADATGVPRSFMEHGFPEENPELGQRVEELEALVSSLRAGLVALSSDVLQHTRELRELRDRDRRTGPE